MSPDQPGAAELSREALADLIRREGYVAPDISPVDPELRTGHQYCASVFSFDWVENFLRDHQMTDVRGQMIHRYKVKGGQFQQFVSLIIGTLVPIWNRQLQQGLVRDVKFRQIYVGGGFTHEIAVELTSTADVHNVKVDFDKQIEALPATQRTQFLDSLDGMVVDFDTAVLEEIPLTLASPPVGMAASPPGRFSP